MAQKQKKNSTLLCTFRKCKQPQTDNEFCTKHQPKRGRNDLIDALCNIELWAEGYSSTPGNLASPKDKKNLKKAYNLLLDFIIYS